MKGRSDNLWKKQYVDHGRSLEVETGHLSTWIPSERQYVFQSHSESISGHPWLSVCSFIQYKSGSL